MPLPYPTAGILSRLSKLSSLFRGVQRGHFSFSDEAKRIYEGDELLISAKGLYASDESHLCERVKA